MHSVCILTDSSAQFSTPVFPGKDLVRVLQLDLAFDNRVYPDGKDLKITRFPISATENNSPKLITPEQNRFSELFLSLCQAYDEILILLISNQLAPIYDMAVRAATPLQSHANIHIINTQTTSIGLGILVQMAAEFVVNGVNINEIERLIRKQVPHIYTLLCTPGLSYLHYSGLIDSAQARVGEILNLYPIFTLEEGRLTPLEKVRNQRTALDFYQEFLGEFDDIRQISLLQGSPQLIQEGRILKQFVSENYPQVPYSEHTINPILATITGPRCLGLVVAENISH